MGECLQNLTCLLRMIVAEGGDGEHHAREWSEIVTLGCGQLEETYSLGAISTAPVRVSIQRKGANFSESM